jgi:uncharacterized repeat protein (TIGR01451 family)
VPPRTFPLPQPITPAPIEEKHGKSEGESGKEEKLTLPRDITATPAASRPDTLVTLEWVGPALTQVGQQAEYSLLVRNNSHVAVGNVVVHVRPTSGMSISSTTPRAAVEGDAQVWRFDTLLPQQQRTLQMQIVVNARGEVVPQASVTFTGSSAAALRIQVREPKLTLKVVSPPRVVAGDSANFILTVTNTGDCLAGQVKVNANLSEGLDHAQGKCPGFEVGDLAIGESRTVNLVCVARAGGEQKCEVVARSGGCVKAQECGAINVIIPSLAVELQGPALRYVDRKATYTLKVVNRGDVPASNVSVQEVIPAGFKFVTAADGGHLTPSTQTVSWFLGELEPGKSRQLQVELLAIKAGEHHHKVTACSERGSKVEVSKDMMTRVEDLSALTLDIAHADDAIEVGKDTTYEVSVTNTGSKMETDIKLICAIPEKMEFRSAQGPMRYHREGNVIVFEPLPRLAPRGDVIYQIKVKALDPGDVRFKVQVTSTNLVEPVIKSEAMRIYSDRP